MTTYHSSMSGEILPDSLPGKEEAAMRSEVPTIRGLRNRTGTACHWNAALVLGAYCLDAIADVAATTYDNDSDAWRAMVHLLRALRCSEGTMDEAVDPTAWFAALSNEAPASSSFRAPEVCGDAVVALLWWLQFLRRGPSGEDPNDRGSSCVAELLDRLLYSGRMHSVLYGSVDANTVVAGECGSLRRKALKERPLWNPFPLSTVSHAMNETGDEYSRRRFTSLTEALQYAFLEEQPVEGYQWPDAAEGSVITTKRCCLTQLPPIFLLHLEGRPVAAPMVGNGEENDRDAMEIPAVLDGSDYIFSSSEEEDGSNINSSPTSSSGGVFHLRGGILHISHRQDGLEEAGDDSTGHYVAIVSTTAPVGADLPPDWYLIDDETVISVPLEQVLSWMSGDWYTPPDICDDADDAQDALYARGILFVYHREDLSEIVDSLSQSWLQQTPFPDTPGARTNASSLHSSNGSSSKTCVRTGPNVSVFGDSSWDPGNDFSSSIDNTTERRVGVPEQFCAQGIRRIDPETGHCVVTYEAPNRASPVLQKSVEWRKNNFVNKDTASSVTLETHVGEANGGSSSKRSSPREESWNEEQRWTGRRLRVLWSGGIYYEGRITHFDPGTGEHTVTYTDGDVRQYQLSQKTFQWLDDDGEEDRSRSTTPPATSAKFSSLWLDDSDVSDNDDA